MTDIRLNKIIHEPARLKILVLLASNAEATSSFTEIKSSLDFSAGNLSIQLKTLEEAGFIAVKKYFCANKPKTEVRITTEGRDALIIYMNELEQLLSTIKRA